MTQIKIAAVYMRGGTSKGVFFCADNLPCDTSERDSILLRVIGSPDAYGKQIDGMGGATSSTSKVAIISKSERENCDVDFLFGAVAINAPFIDWSGNCGNLTAAVGPFAICQGLMEACANGVQRVHIWQANIGKRIIAHVQMRDGQVLEEGDFELDGVSVPAAEIKLEFLDPGGAGDESSGGHMFPTGHVVDVLEIAGLGNLEATLINAGNPTVIIKAESLGLKGTELQHDFDGNESLLNLCEAIRAQGAVVMGLATNTRQATSQRPATPKLAFVSPPQSYRASNGKPVAAESIDLNARILSMGKLHHAMTGTGAIALAVAAVIPGTLVERCLGKRCESICFGHPSGTLRVGANAVFEQGEWKVTSAKMSRSARRLMEGWVCVNSNTGDET